MDRASFESFRENIVREYAADKVKAGHWPQAESLARAEAETAALLPTGLETPETWLWTIRDAADADLGVLWVARYAEGGPRLWIYDIEVRPEARGRGVGRAALEALEDWARSEGFEQIGLHVFGANATARRLYARMGYAEVDVAMRKDL